MEYSFEVGEVQPISAGMGIGILVAYIIVYLFMALCLALIAKKQGKSFGGSLVMAIIPIANVILFLQLSGKPWWWLFLFIIPIVNLVLYIIALIGLSERMKRPGWFAVILILFPIVGMPILAFSKMPEASSPAPAAPAV